MKKILLFFAFTFLVKVSFSQTYSITRSLPTAELIGTPTAVTGLGDDNATGALNIGFNFSFYSNTYTQFYIGSNGVISFGSAQSGTYGSAQPTNFNAITFAGADLDCGPSYSPSAIINYFTTGTSPNRILVVNFKNIKTQTSPSNFSNVQVQLFEGTNKIELHVGNVQSAPGTFNRGIGLCNSTGSLFATQANINGVNTVNVVNEMIRFTPVPLPPEINIKGNAVSIANGDVIPSTADHTDFGATDIASGSVVRTFTIENTANPTLTLSGSPRVNITGANASDFNVTTVPASTVAGLGSTTFQVTFNPSSTGVKQAVVSIANNDLDENPYTFGIYGIGSAVGGLSPFVTRWNLATTGFGSTLISFGVETVGTVNYTWTQIGGTGASGAGTFSGTTAIITGLPANGIIDLFIEPTNFQRININNGSDRNRLIDVKQWGSVAWTSMATAFDGCNNLNATATDVPNLLGCPSLLYMFRNCNSLNGLINIGSWNTTAVTNMGGLFNGATSFNQNIGLWNTAAVTNMNSMFSGATAFNQNIGSWNTAAVTSMYRMFNQATAFNQNISSWNTAAVTDMTQLFNQATVFNQNISSWNTEAVTNMTGLFTGATSFNQNISSWNTAAVTNMTGLFAGATSFNQNISSWNTAAVTNMNVMFDGATSFNQNISAWNINNVVGMSSFFANSGLNIANYDAMLTTWSTSSYTNKNLGTASPLKYCAATAARTILTTPVANGGKGWLIFADAPCSPEINIKGNGINIVSGSILPSPTNHTEFGSVLVSSGTMIRTFTIENLGAAALTLSGSPLVSISGANASDFTLTVLPVTPVAVSASTTFQITFDPSVVGQRNATLSITNNDSNENPYTFEITGVGVAVVGPEMNVKGYGTQTIISGSTTTQSTNSTEFGSVLATSGTTTRIFTVENIGTTNLLLSGSPIVSITGANASDFTLTVVPATTVVPAGSTTFEITFDPSAAGTRTATISIANNDADENPYTFVINGTGNLQSDMFITRWNLSLAPGTTTLNCGFIGSGGVPVNYTWQVAGGGSSGSGTLGGTYSSTITGLPSGAVIDLSIGPKHLQFVRINLTTDYGKLIDVKQWGTTAWTTMLNAFANCYNLNITATDVPNLSGVTNMSNMFLNCSILNGPININSWNTAVVTNMSSLFAGTFFNQNIGSWNTSAVTNMSGMFSSAGAFNQNIGSWNTSAVTNMSNMFSGAVTFNQNIGSWNTSAVTNMSSMFQVATTFNQNISSWNINNATNMLNIFSNSGVNITNYDAMLTTWSTSSYINKNLGNVLPLQYCAATAARATLTSPVASGGKGWTISGDVSCSPEINIKGNGVSILNGSGVISAANHTDFGPVLVSSGTLIRTFTIENLGTGSLTLSGSPIVSITGVNASDFTLTALPTTPVSASGSTTFQITFDPLAVGQRNADLRITNNDSNEGFYVIFIRGNGVAIVEPEINVKGYGITSIVSGSTSTQSSNSTEFGSVLVPSGVTTRIFTIENLGTANLLLSGSPIVSITGANASDFTLTIVPATTVVPAGSTTFEITFDPSAAGIRTATISIANNDANENPYTFVINGVGHLQSDVFITRWNLPLTSGTTTLNCGFIGSGGVPVNYTWQVVGSGASGSGILGGTFSSTITGLPSGAVIDLSIGPKYLEFVRMTLTTDNSKLIDVKQWGTTAWTTMLSAFSGCNSLNITATDVPDLAGVTNMNSMFLNCSALNSPTNINSWNTSAVISMVSMFRSTSFNQNISSWNTSAVTNMNSMFLGTTAFNQNISSWNTAAVLNMNSMFIGATAFNQNIGSWNINNVTDILNIFNNSGINVSNYDAILTAWNTVGYTNKNLGNAAPLKYCTAVAARTSLTTTVAGGGRGWTITGDALNSGCGTPEINLRGNSVNIVNGDITPSTTDHTDFGSVNVVSATIVRTFTIQNSGIIALTLSGSPIVSITGANASDFILTVLPATPVAIAGSTAFQITFNPSAGGLRSATISIANNDSNENPYTFGIQGTGTTCQTAVTLQSTADDVSSGTTIKEANITTGAITATNRITGTARVTYRAGKTITLNPGFKADGGTVFKTEFGGCN